MEIKNVKKTKLFSKEIRTSLKSIGQYVGALPEELLHQMNQKGLKAQGPQVWIYKGADGNPETEFDLTVGFPVADDVNTNEIVPANDFKCAVISHKGDWSNLKNTYCKVISELTEQGMVMTGECREIYHQVDFENAENNLTEVQIGIK